MLLKFRISMLLHINSKSLLAIISKVFRTLEKMMMLDITAAREGFRDN